MKLHKTTKKLSRPMVPPPSWQATGTVTLVMATTIFIMLLVVTWQHLADRPIIYWTLLIDILFCVSMLVSSARQLGVEIDIRDRLMELEQQLRADQEEAEGGA